MLKEVCYLAVLLLIFTACSNQESFKANSEQAHAVLVPGSGTYSRKISTQNPEAQAFFDQGLRLAWGFYFPESIASFQEAARIDPWPMQWDQILIHATHGCQTTRKVKVLRQSKRP